MRTLSHRVDPDFANLCYNFYYQWPWPAGEPRQLRQFRHARLKSAARVIPGGPARASDDPGQRTNQSPHGECEIPAQLLNEIPGIKPAKLYDGVTRSAYHLYMFRYDPARFAGISRGKFMEAMGQEGVPCSGGYGVLNKDAYVSGLAKNKHFLKLYGEQRMKQWLEQNLDCPQNEKLCGEAVWFTQNMLLGPREDVEQVAAAVRKLQKHAGDLAKK